MRWISIFISLLVLLAGCTQLEVPFKEIYPFRAEFVCQGRFKLNELDLNGAIYLTSSNAGIMQTYLPGGMVLHTIDIDSDKLVIKDMWGEEIDTIKLPLTGIAGMLAGDIPKQKYLYKEKIKDGLRVVYPWGALYTDDAIHPKQVHVQSKPPIDIFFKPDKRNVTMEIIYGNETMKVLFLIKEGGRWFSL